MNSIFEILQKLPPVIETIIGTYTSNSVLFPLKDAVYSLQMTWHWLKNANDELKTYEESVIEERMEPIPMKRAPTLLGTSEQFDYAIRELKSISAETREYASTNVLPPAIQYKVNRGYDRMMEALFNTETAKQHYGDFTTRGESTQG